jgi:hypothetical protein
VKYKVVPAPAVTLAVSFLSDSLQWFFKNQIIPILEDDPYPSPMFPLIEERTGDDGRAFYQYFDGIVPLVFQYRVYRSDVDWQPGLVWLAYALREDEV